jgi:hypothetical protein
MEMCWDMWISRKTNKGELKMEERYDEIIEELVEKAKSLGFQLKSEQIHFDDSRSWSLYVYGRTLGLSCYKFGAYRNYHGGGCRDAMEHNGRSQDNTHELGEAFKNALLQIEALINEGYEDADPWELPTGVLM